MIVAQKTGRFLLRRGAAQVVRCRAVKASHLLLVVLLGAGCQRSPAGGAAAARPVPDAAVACTLETPLVPGVPGSPGHLIPSDINPNGQSELAHLMRTMQTDLKAARALIAKREAPRLLIGQGQKVGPLAGRFARIRCSWPTAPADRDARFDANAQLYLQAVAELDAAPVQDAAPAYDRVLTACRACHEQSCTGAIPAIEALRLKPTARP